MAATMEPDASSAAPGETKSCGVCEASLLRVEVSTRLSAHLPGDTPDAYWTATPLDSWLCPRCGRTELYARHPEVFTR